MEGTLATIFLTHISLFIENNYLRIIHVGLKSKKFIFFFTGQY